ncbi:hypothetical protein ES703_82119 [subsurface metagenome]
MSNKPEWPDKILGEILAEETLKKLDSAGNQSERVKETKWEDLPPQVQYAIKAERARRCEIFWVDTSW